MRLRIIFILCAALLLGGVRSCCNSSTTAVMTGEGRAYKWVDRNVTSGLPLQRDQANIIDEAIFTLEPPFNEYSYKVGPKATTDCNLSSGYSTWRQKTSRMQISLAPYAVNEVMIICLLARGVNDCGELVTQSYINSTDYHWIKSASLGDFSILSPAELTNDATPVINWQPSQLATSYQVVVSQNADCSNPIQTHEVTNGTNIEVLPLNDGDYYACVYSKENDLGTHAALNNPLTFKVDTTPPGSWQLTVPSTNNNPQSISVFWNSASDVEFYKIFVSATANCGSAINTWDNLTNTYLNISVPDYGTYYLCGEARDTAGNIRFPSNNGLQFTVSMLENITLLDNIGADPLVSDRNISIGNHINSDESGWYQLGVFNLSVPSRVRLTRFIAHMDGSRPSPQGYLCGPNSSAFDIKLNIWSSIEMARLNPKNGNQINISLVPEALIDRSTTGGISLTGCPIERLEIDLSYANIILEAGNEYYFSLGFEGLAADDGVWGIMESDFSGPSDWIIYDDYLNSKRKDQVTTFAGSQNGKLAVKVLGVPE